MTTAIRHFSFYIGLLITALCMGCHPVKKVPPKPIANVELFDSSGFDAEEAYDEVSRFVQLGPRDSGTPGAKKAALYLATRLRELGVVDVEVDVFTNATPQGSTVFRNVIGTLPGEGRGLIILGSHYDTKSGISTNFAGANDSGSSTGVLLEMGRIMALSPDVGAEIQLVFFDGEEAMVNYGPTDGLQGSRRHAARLVENGRAKEVMGVINLDMIGDRNLNVMLPRNSTASLAQSLLNAAHREQVRKQFSLYQHQIGDDHVAFLDAGMPAIDIIDFEYGTEPGKNDIWHTEADSMDKISADSLGIIGRVTLRMVNDLLAGLKGNET